MKSLFFWGVAILLICIAHLIRVVRWALFIDIYEKPDRKSLIRSIALGFLLNFFLPFKAGDFFRAYYAGKRMKNGTPLALSTIIVDRYLDIVCVGVIFSFLTLGKIGDSSYKDVSTFYLFLAIIFLLLFIAFYFFRGMVKKVIRNVAGIFNSKIETQVLQFSWALIWNFKDIFQRIDKMKLILSSITMWVCYISSYFCLATYYSYSYEKTSWVDVFAILFNQKGLKASTIKSTLGVTYLGNNPISMIGYMISPLILMVAFSCLVKAKENDKTEEQYLNLLPHMDPQERLHFLEGYFENSNGDYIKRYLEINQNILIIRDYSAGSNATTMLCMDGESTFFRKYALGDEGEKLYRQVQWIEKNKDTLALPKIIKCNKSDSYCYYDMPYNGNTMGLFEYIHSVPITKAWDMVYGIIKMLEEKLYVAPKMVDKNIIDTYIQNKIMGNKERLSESRNIRNLLQYDSVIINGIEYRNLKAYEKLFKKDYMKEVFADDMYTEIHGDLTIENIICTRDENGVDGFYIIDPNSDNVLNSPNLDYAKLLQSLHGGYEFLMSAKEVKVTHNRVDYLFVKSASYIELFNKLNDYLKEKKDWKCIRSIYFHEIVHWLRLMPYKIEKDDKRAVLFYSRLLIILNDYMEMFGANEE